MHFLSILFFCIASSSDNFVIGLSYGGKSIKISLASNMLVASISCIGTFLAMLLGRWLYNLISPQTANILGSALLILFGLYMLVNSIKEKANSSSVEIKGYNGYIQHPEIMDTDNSKEIEIKEALTLGFILCLNNIGLGIGASITGLNIYATSLLSFIFSVIFIKLGSYIGHKILSSRLEAYSEYISAGIIILLGIYELIV